MLTNILFPRQPAWRTFEREAAVEVFGGVTDVKLGAGEYPAAQFMRWFPPSEMITADEHHRMLGAVISSDGDVHHINDPRGYLLMHDKLAAFARWREVGLGEHVPDYVELTPGWRPPWPPPYLLRLNNSVAGQHSTLVVHPREETAATAEVCGWLHAARNSGWGLAHRAFAVKYYDTAVQGLNVSYRIIVAGGRVVTGYARVSDPADWVAVTNKFHAGIADAWLEANRRCHAFIAAHEATLVQAVAALGLNHQGLDVIESGDAWYLLETQTTYDAGFLNAGPYRPPFYNPYNPDLVKFIQENRALIARDLPLYHDAWLDKREHFRRCYAAIKLANTKSQS